MYVAAQVVKEFKAVTLTIHALKNEDTVSMKSQTQKKKKKKKTEA